MAYFEPYIDESGLHIPSYPDIREHLLEQARSIFGQDVYLEHDSQDYQLISVFADKLHDTMQMAQLVYNNRGPASAKGGGLDGIVPVNGIRRKPPTRSTCRVDITGSPNTRIINGVVSDSRNGHNWNLPPEVIIPFTGFVRATATCQEYGPIYVAPGELDGIVTPVQGWTSVTNQEEPVLGQNRETDAALRERQKVSTALPSRTIIDGIKGAVADVPGVTRYRVYENDANEPDARGIPGHSICAVVEGGEDRAIAEAIYAKKTPGGYTHGEVEVNVIDVYGHYACPPIRFFRPIYKDIYTTINVRALDGYTTDTTTRIAEEVAKYQNSIRIGDNLSVSALWGAALSAMRELSSPTFSITSISAGLEEEAQGQDDIEIAFNEGARGDVNNIVVNVV